MGGLERGMKSARIQQCRECQYWRNNYKHWDWPHCHYGCTEINGQCSGCFELSDGFMSSPVSDCPAGLWEGLAPLDSEALQQERREASMHRQKQQFCPMLLMVFEDTAEEKKLAALERLVEAGYLEPEVATEIALGGSAPA